MSFGKAAQEFYKQIKSKEHLRNKYQYDSRSGSESAGLWGAGDQGLRAGNCSGEPGSGMASGS